MKKLVVACFVIVMMAFLTGQAIATKPGNDVNPNGFPSGEHYNLNIIGKKDTFTCPEPEFDPVTGEPIYGKVIFVPQNGEDIQILMESGKKGGKGSKNAALPDTLQVTDPCTAVFDEDPAVLQLPKGEHWVYARALATPGEDVGMIITPGLIGAEDEYGNALIYLGLLSADGTFQMPNKSFERPKGKPNAAANITGLFTWSGIVFYLDEADIPEGEEDNYDDCQICIIDDDGDGVADRYAEPDFVADPEDGCLDGIPTVVYCREYTDEWVFNIADFVTYLWSLDNKGLKLLQIRFYPVNSEPEAAPSRLKALTTKWGELKAE